MSNVTQWIMPWRAYNGIDAMRNNVVCVVGYMCGVLGWHINAVMGVCGNLYSESTLNPALWQGRVEPYDPAGGGGFGLVQWTPWGKLTRWAHDRKLSIYSPYTQMDKMQYEVHNPTVGDDYNYGYQWGYSGPNAAADGVPSGITYEQFTQADGGEWDAAYCAKVFYWYYEKSAAASSGSRPTRAANFYSWYTETYDGTTQHYYPWTHYIDEGYPVDEPSALVAIIGRTRRKPTWRGMIYR